MSRIHSGDNTPCSLDSGHNGLAAPSTREIPFPLYPTRSLEDFCQVPAHVLLLGGIHCSRFGANKGP